MIPIQGRDIYLDALFERAVVPVASVLSSLVASTRVGFFRSFMNWDFKDTFFAVGLLSINVVVRGSRTRGVGYYSSLARTEMFSPSRLR